MYSDEQEQLLQSSIIILQVIAYVFYIFSFLFIDSIDAYRSFYLNPNNRIGMIQKIYYISIMSINIIALLVLCFGSNPTKWKKQKRTYIILSLLALPFSLIQLVYVLAIQQPNIRFFSYWDMSYREVYAFRLLSLSLILFGVAIYAVLLAITRVTLLFDNEYINHTVKVDYRSLIIPMEDNSVNFNGYIKFFYDENEELYKLDIDMYYYDIRSSSFESPDGSIVIDGVNVCDNTEEGIFDNKDFSCVLKKEQLDELSTDSHTIEFVDMEGNQYSIEGTRTETNEVYRVNVFWINSKLDED